MDVYMIGEMVVEKNMMEAVARDCNRPVKLVSEMDGVRIWKVPAY